MPSSRSPARTGARRPPATRTRTRATRPYAPRAWRRAGALLASSSPTCSASLRSYVSNPRSLREEVCVRLRRGLTSQINVALDALVARVLLLLLYLVQAD